MYRNGIYGYIAMRALLVKLASHCIISYPHVLTIYYNAMDGGATINIVIIMRGFNGYLQAPHRMLNIA